MNFLKVCSYLTFVSFDVPDYFILYETISFGFRNPVLTWFPSYFSCCFLPISFMDSTVSNWFLHLLSSRALILPWLFYSVLPWRILPIYSQVNSYVCIIDSKHISLVCTSWLNLRSIYLTAYGIATPLKSPNPLYSLCLIILSLPNMYIFLQLPSW